jgi:Heterokaryon incompatibility protein (HET)
MSLPYQYTDLAEDEIRLVDVISGSDPAELRCSLQHVSVHEKNLDYVALSYTWQDPTVGLSQATETKCSILIDGHPLPILSNLAVALVELRARSTGPVWVDAICINQANIQERNHQVAHMQSIYSKAREVIIWLGPEAQGSNMAIELLRLMSTKSALYGISWLRQTIRDDQANPHWLSLCQLFERTWWTRTWVIQETVAAKSLSFLCGSHSLGWGEMGEAIELISRSWSYLAPMLLQQKQLMFNYQSLNGIRSHYHLRATRDRPCLLYLLHLTNSLQASDNRDKIFAIQGLASDSESLAFTPDYLPSVGDVYISFAQALIERQQSMDVITLANCEEFASGLPSWVPDWSRGSNPTPLIPYISQMRPQNHGYSAADGSLHCVTFSKDMQSLHCRGLIIDEVDGLSFFPWTGHPHIRKAKQSQYGENAYGSGRNVFDAIWRSLVGNLSRYRHKVTKAPTQFGAIFATHWLACESDGEILSRHGIEQSVSYRSQASDFEKWFAGICEHKIGSKTFREWILREGPGFVEEYASRMNMDGLPEDAFEQNRSLMLYKRRFLTTRRGYVGIGPGYAERYDKICILFGCKVPVVLRPQGRSYRLVGECYIHGVMQGEAMKGLQKGAFTLEEFALL